MTARGDLVFESGKHAAQWATDACAAPEEHTDSTKNHHMVVVETDGDDRAACLNQVYAYLLHRRSRRTGAKSRGMNAEC